MSTTVTEPLFVAPARLVKAAKLAAACKALGQDAHSAAHITPEHRKSIARYASCRAPSDATWRLVVGILAGSTTIACPTCGLGNPAGGIGPALRFGHDGECRR